MTASSCGKATACYLADAYGEGTLGTRNPRERARSDQWMEWYKTTFYDPFIAIYQMFIRTEPASRDLARLGELAQTVGELLRIPHAELRRHSFLSGDHFGIGDIPLGSALYRYVSLPTPRPLLEGIDAWYARLCERPSYRSSVMRPFRHTPSQFRRLEQEDAEPRTRK
jgi:glutathione S-transferase